MRYTKKGIKSSKYLTDYPFPYYVVLREIGSLQEVLADALRQWFEMLSCAELIRAVTL